MVLDSTPCEGLDSALVWTFYLGLRATLGDVFFKRPVEHLTATSLGTDHLPLRAFFSHMLGHFCLLLLLSTAERAPNDLERTDGIVSCDTLCLEVSDAAVELAIDQSFLTAKIAHQHQLHALITSKYLTFLLDVLLDLACR